MRMAARRVTAEVSIDINGTPRPVRLMIGGISYRLHPDEAIGLANQLADTVEQLEERNNR